MYKKLWYAFTQVIKFTWCLEELSGIALGDFLQTGRKLSNVYNIFKNIFSHNYLGTVFRLCENSMAFAEKCISVKMNK